MKRLYSAFLVGSLACVWLLAQPATSSACVWGWRCAGSWCGWRSCGWNSCGWGWRSCGWGAWGCGWGGCGPGWIAPAPVFWSGPVGWDCCVGPAFVGPVVSGPIAVPISPTTTVALNGIMDDPPLLVGPPRYVIRPRYQPATPQAPAEMLPAPEVEPASSKIEVRVPTAAAEVWFSGHKTKQTGLTRNFETPVLQPGKTYAYQVVVRWTDEDGATLEDSYRLELRAGRQAVVAFSDRPGKTSSWVALRSNTGSNR